MVKIVWTEKAANHLEDIYRYIANDSSYYARRFVKSLVGSVQHLQVQPLCGRIVPEIDKQDIRELIYRGYRIVYRFLEEHDRIDVLAIIHSARDFADAFKENTE